MATHLPTHDEPGGFLLELLQFAGWRLELRGGERAVRYAGSWNIVRISDSVDGASVAPATPSSARAPISISALVEKAASSEPRPNATAPIRSSLRRPIRSPSVPIVINIPATRKP